MKPPNHTWIVVEEMEKLDMFYGLSKEGLKDARARVDRLQVLSDFDAQVEELAEVFLAQTETDSLDDFLHKQIGHGPNGLDGETVREFCQRKHELQTALREKLRGQWPVIENYSPTTPSEPSQCPVCTAPGEGNEDQGAWECGRQRTFEGQFFIQCEHAETMLFRLQAEHEMLLDKVRRLEAELAELRNW